MSKLTLKVKTLLKNNKLWIWLQICVLSFETWHTEIGWILRSLWGEYQTKVQLCWLHFEKNRHPWRTQYHACNDRLSLMSNHFTADNKMRPRVSIDWHAYAKTAEIVQSAKDKSDFSVSCLKLKEYKFLIKFIMVVFLSRGYTLSVITELIY